MDFSSHDAAAARFRGTRYAYDRREVDVFRDQVVAALVAHETALAEARERIQGLEKALAHTTRARAHRESLPQGAPAVEPPRTGVAPVSSNAGGANASNDEFAAFDAWREGLVVRDSVRTTLAAADEDARMIRALAAAHAADDIAALTAEARAGALEVTQRAAQLATRTEEAARTRATGILATVEDGGAERDVDIDEISQRIIGLRSSIADVQDRLESIVDDDDATTRSGDADVIELDLRSDGQSAKGSGKTQPKRRRAKGDATGGALDTSALEARLETLKERLHTD